MVDVRVYVIDILTVSMELVHDINLIPIIVLAMVIV